MWTVILFAILAGGLISLFWPLLGRPLPWALPSADSGVVRLLRKEKEKLFRMLKDLEFERDAGTLGTAEYEELHEVYLHEVALVNRRLEAVTEAAESVSGGGER